MRRLSAVVTVLMLALAPACAQASAQERIALAATKTKDIGSARMSMTVDMTGGPQEVSVTSEGAVDFESQQSVMTSDLGELGDQMGMGNIEVITQATTIYMKYENHEQFGIPTPWVKMDLEKATGLEGMGAMQQMNNDPAQSLEMLRGVSEDIEEVGTEDIRGTSTTHYKATVDVDKALAEMPEEARPSFKAQYETMGLESIPTEVWIDDEGLLRRQKVELDLSNAEGALAAGGQGPTALSFDYELYDFGAEVNVELPPADEVTDFAELAG